MLNVTDSSSISVCTIETQKGQGLAIMQGSTVRVVMPSELKTQSDFHKHLVQVPNPRRTFINLVRVMRIVVNGKAIEVLVPTTSNSNTEPECYVVEFDESLSPMSCETAYMFERATPLMVACAYWIEATHLTPPSESITL